MSTDLSTDEGSRAEVVDSADHPPQPTGEQCEARARSTWQGNLVVACWYPQMGGYVGKAVMVMSTGPMPTDDDDRCFDIYVWHDGEFPFDDGRPPVRLHHCSGHQFIAFGELALELCAEATKVRP
jgi:hypothetical protein